MNSNLPTDESIALYAEGVKALGTSLIPQQDMKATLNGELGCADSLCKLYQRTFPTNASVLNTLSTAVLLGQLLANPDLFEEIANINLALPGDIIIAATGTSKLPETSVTNGHVGVVAKHGVMSNESATALWTENFVPLNAFINRYSLIGGYPVRIFRPIG